MKYLIKFYDLFVQVGHALHIHHPTFRAVTVNDRVRDVCKKLGFRRPAIPQSMYIYKNPGIGGEGMHLIDLHQISAALLLIIFY